MSEGGKSRIRWRLTPPFSPFQPQKKESRVEEGMSDRRQSKRVVPTIFLLRLPTQRWTWTRSKLKKPARSTSLCWKEMTPQNCREVSKKQLEKTKIKELRKNKGGHLTSPRKTLILVDSFTKVWKDEYRRFVGSVGDTCLETYQTLRRKKQVVGDPHV